jgi:hypothetical protein
MSILRLAVRHMSRTQTRFKIFQGKAMIANRTKPAIEEEKGCLRQIAAKWSNSRWHFPLRVGIAASMMPFFILGGSTNLKTVWDSAENKVIRVSNQAAVYYDDVRLVYQITSRLRELQEQEEVAAHQGEAPHSEAAISSEGKCGSLHSRHLQS